MNAKFAGRSHQTATASEYMTGIRICKVAFVYLSDTGLSTKPGRQVFIVRASRPRPKRLSSRNIHAASYAVGLSGDEARAHGLGWFPLRNHDVRIAES